MPGIVGEVVTTDKPGRDRRETSGPSTVRPLQSLFRGGGSANCNKLHKGSRRSRRSRRRRAEHLRSDLLITCLQRGIISAFILLLKSQASIVRLKHQEVKETRERYIVSLI